MLRRLSGLGRKNFKGEILLKEMDKEIEKLNSKLKREEDISRKAVSFVLWYEHTQKRECVDMQTKSGFKGFDILSFSKGKEEDKEVRAIEVKGTTSKDKIPDLFETEVSRSKKLIATHLYLVVFGNGSKKDPTKLFIIPANAFKSEDFYETKHYRIKSNFYTRYGKLKEFEQKFYE